MRWPSETGQRPQQRCLARTRRADDGEHAPGSKREGHALEERRSVHDDLHARHIEVGAIALGELLQGSVVIPEDVIAYGDGVVFANDDPIDPPAVHEGPVVAVQVDKLHPAVGELAKLGVMP